MNLPAALSCLPIMLFEFTNFPFRKTKSVLFILPLKYEFHPSPLVCGTFEIVKA